MIEISDVSRDVAQVRRLHAFLLPHFGAEELEPLSFYEAGATADDPVDIILLMGCEDGEPVSGAIVELLPLSGGRALGAVGHALVSPTLRGRGAGQQLMDAADAAMARHAAARGWRVEANILESEAGAARFWSRQGYRWPEGMRFWQPPLAYAPDGTPALPHIPLFLMIRHPEHGQQMPAALVAEYTDALLRQWYRDELPTLVAEPAACERARQWFDQAMLAPAIASIAEERVAMQDLSAWSLAEAERRLSAMAETR